MARILVIRGGAIGDFVLTLPALKLLRESFPSAHIEILGYRHIIALAENRFYAQAVRSIEYGALSSFFSRGAELPEELVEYFASFGQVISYLFDPDRIFADNLARAGVKNLIMGAAKITDEAHAARQLARPLEQLALFLDDPAAQIFSSAEDEQFAAELVGKLRAPVIALHPGSGGERKNWPLENWLALGERLMSATPAPTLLVIGGEAEMTALEKLRAAWAGRPVEFVQNLALPQLAAVIARCSIFIGHDSGISHLAAATGTACVLLFGPTDAAIWAPANPNVRVLEAPGGSLARLPMEEVAAAVIAFWQSYTSSS